MKGHQEGTESSGGDGESVKNGVLGKELGEPGGTDPKFKTVDGSYHFTLSGYSLAKGVGSGKYFSSGSFAVGGHEWAIYFYPDGKSDSDHAEFVSVFIVLASDSVDVQALFEITLLDRSGRGKHKIHSHFNGRIKSPYKLESQGAMWGYKRYFRRSALDRSVFLKDDTLEFTGKVGVLLTSVKPTKLHPASISPTHHQGQDSSTPYLQSTADEESTSENMEVTDSQSEDDFASNFKVLRLEDELAKYHLRLFNNQSPMRASERTDPEKHASAFTESAAA